MNADTTVTYQSPSIERILGYPANDTSSARRFDDLDRGRPTPSTSATCRGGRRDGRRRAHPSPSQCVLAPPRRDQTRHFEITVHEPRSTTSTSAACPQRPRRQRAQGLRGGALRTRRSTTRSPASPTARCSASGSASRIARGGRGGDGAGGALPRHRPLQDRQRSLGHGAGDALLIDVAHHGSTPTAKAIRQRGLAATSSPCWSTGCPAPTRRPPSSAGTRTPSTRCSARWRSSARSCHGRGQHRIATGPSAARRDGRGAAPGRRRGDVPGEGAPAGGSSSDLRSRRCTPWPRSSACSSEGELRRAVTRPAGGRLPHGRRRDRCVRSDAAGRLPHWRTSPSSRSPRARCRASEALLALAAPGAGTDPAGRSSCRSPRRRASSCRSAAWVLHAACRQAGEWPGARTRRRRRCGSR